MPIYDYECDNCHKVTESIQKTDTLALECPDCGFMAHRIMTKPPTWKFAEIKNGMWVGDTAKALKIARQRPPKKQYFFNKK